jgi:hypothetical protein
MRRRRAERKAWDQQPENREKVRERKRRWVRELRWRRRDAGLCANCGQPKLSEWYCWDCLNKKEDWHVELAAQRPSTPDSTEGWPTPRQMSLTTTQSAVSMKFAGHF